MSKVHLVLEYCLHNGQYESCRVDRVYKKACLARKRKKFLEKINLVPEITYHTIQKTLKGK